MCNGCIKALRWGDNGKLQYRSCINGEQVWNDVPYVSASGGTSTTPPLDIEQDLDLPTDDPVIEAALPDNSCFKATAIVEELARFMDSIYAAFNASTPLGQGGIIGWTATNGGKFQTVLVKRTTMLATMTSTIMANWPAIRDEQRANWVCALTALMSKSAALTDDDIDALRGYEFDTGENDLNERLHDATEVISKAGWKTASYSGIAAKICECGTFTVPGQDAHGPDNTTPPPANYEKFRLVQFTGLTYGGSATLQAFVANSPNGSFSQGRFRGTVADSDQYTDSVGIGLLLELPRLDSWAINIVVEVSNAHDSWYTLAFFEDYSGLIPGGVTRFSPLNGYFELTLGPANGKYALITLMSANLDGETPASINVRDIEAGTGSEQSWLLGDVRRG